MPELFLIYLLGVGTGLLTTGLFLFMIYRMTRSIEMKTLNANLALCGRFWSVTEAQILPFHPAGPGQDFLRIRNQTLLIGAFLSFASWPGVLFLALIMFSMHYIARPRLERAIFESELARKRLDQDEVLEVLSRLGVN